MLCANGALQFTSGIQILRRTVNKFVQSANVPLSQSRPCFDLHMDCFCLGLGVWFCKKRCSRLFDSWISCKWDSSSIHFFSQATMVSGHVAWQCLHILHLDLESIRTYPWQLATFRLKCVRLRGPCRTGRHRSIHFSAAASCELRYDCLHPRSFWASFNTWLRIAHAVCQSGLKVWKSHCPKDLRPPLATGQMLFRDAHAACLIYVSMCLFIGIWLLDCWLTC